MKAKKKMIVGLGVFVLSCIALYATATGIIKTNSGNITIDPAGGGVVIDGDLDIGAGHLYMDKEKDFYLDDKKAISTDGNTPPNMQLNYGNNLRGYYMYGGTANEIIMGYWDYDDQIYIRGDFRVPDGGVCVDDDGSCTAPSDGYITAVGYNTNHSDIAEMVRVNEEVENGDALCQYPEGSVLKCREPYSYSVIGIVSTKPGFLLNYGCGGVDSIFTVDDTPCAAPPENIEGCGYGGRCIGATWNEEKGEWNKDGKCNGTYMADDPEACEDWVPIAGFGEITAKVVCGRGGTDKTGKFEYSNKQLQPGDRLVSSDYGDGGYLEGIPGNKNAGDGLFAIAKEGCPKGEETATIRVWVR